ncbi:MAG: glutamine-hydrolyzing GMP synthase [candidate division Zixibacteria bacterium]|nr:glutamine-hydrolyzing GMP synthase [candidate division Zixibacteria bacterium]NIR62974.1 glutamine-hydrolyzing GMP synthase [candidate division Zixibacteria bacterium]NIS16161.1 glutamine-hydrolyzing GMP synthase [candidate division Zixibacteria bacterium]NIS44995.1 glutamine-hydrolyzing GMP synthase [candidate division Zixibacteria bacterium]NIT52557.1 glutamine-hydrolyzing GMP synthase [candidate division Zixibacteria bacterium]
MIEEILILDFGSQYTQLIARKIRELNVYCEIVPFNFPIEEARSKNLKGLVLSGGPASVLADDAYFCDPAYFDMGLPILGICYGLQLIGLTMGGELQRSRSREYGPAMLTPTEKSLLFDGIEEPSRVWMSHGDSLDKLPPGFINIGKTSQVEHSAIANQDKKIYGLQFHPEVYHTQNGKQILSNFLFKICEAGGDWTMESFIEDSVRRIREMAGRSRVLCAVSGGVDSSVCALLLSKAIGKNLVAVFVNNGLLRKDEDTAVIRELADLNVDIRAVDASEIFLSRLKGVIDPEEKRKIIGRTFIEVFDEKAKELGQVDFLAQGTLYPDVIESVSFKGPSATIKSHHNVGGLPEKMDLKLIEPLRELFKDEVRALGEKLGLKKDLLMRHPFPGPGLAVRILGEITKERLELVREADAIFIQSLRDFNYYDKVWQAFCVLLPVQAVGVMGDERTYENVLALRAVSSTDGMTADWSRLPNDLLEHVSSTIVNKIKGINRVVYDISSKPPATIEWE